MGEAIGGDQGLVRLSESAARRIIALRDQEGDATLMLRVDQGLSYEDADLLAAPGGSSARRWRAP